MLFADLVGFTSLSERRDPEDVREVLSRYFEVARQVMGRYGGIVEKFIGDAVMAVWGTPVAREGDAERAVRAALEFVSAVELLADEVGAPGLAARAGIVTGEVAVNIGATGQGMVAGDAVNTASRVQAAARPGKVLVDDTTRRLAERAIGMEDEGYHDLKGKELPEHLYRATRVLSTVGGRQRGDLLEAPLVGRDAELRALKELFHGTVERRVPRLVVVSGPAGVGKSRIGWEFEKYTDGLADSVYWHRGRCLSYGDGVAFWALAEIVRSRFAIADEDDTATASGKLLDGLGGFVPDEQERDYVGVRLARLLGLSHPSDTGLALGQDELYAGWRLFFERLAALAPVVILVEDAHHADGSLLGFFSHVIDWSRDLPIFILVFARPGLAAIDSGYGIGRNRSTFSLDPLDRSSMRALVERLVPGMPAHGADAIVARAHGIPLFAVETIRSLIDQKIVENKEGSYALVGELDRLTVPDTLHSLLAARLDALEPEVRRLVADASVLGSTFTKEALAAVAGRPEDDVARALSELCRRDVFEIVADQHSPERASFRFTQDMLRQVAYATLSKRDRTARHLAVAEYLRRVFANDGEEIADVVARHYLDAASLAEERESGTLMGEALSFLTRAAERAERTGAPGRAADSFALAAGIVSSRQAPAYLERAAQAALRYGDHEAALVHAETALEALRQFGETRSAARLQSFKARLLQLTGQSAAARREISEALEVLRANPDEDTVDALRSLATIEIFGGNLGDGEGLVSEALELAQAVDAGPLAVARLFDIKGLAASFANRNAEAAAYLEAAARIAERTGEIGTLGIVQMNLADVLARSDPEAAVEVGRSAVAHARRTGRRRDLGLSTANLAIALLEVGRWDEASGVLDEAVIVDHVEDEDVNRLLGWVAGLRGEGGGVAAALGLLSESRANDEPQAQASVGFLEALAALSRGAAGEALEHARRVLDKRNAIGIGHEAERWSWPLAARVAHQLGEHEVVGELLAMLEEHPPGHLPPVLRAERQLVSTLARPGGTAGGELKDALEALRAAGNPYQLAHGLLDCAEVVGRTGSSVAEDLVREATEIGAALGCPPLIERARSLAAFSVGPAS